MQISSNILEGSVSYNHEHENYHIFTASYLPSMLFWAD